MNLPRRQYSNETTASVIPFPSRHMSRTTGSGSVGDRDLIPPGISDASDFAERVAHLLTAKMAAIMAEQAIANGGQWNPFDAIFLSKLKPDRFEIPASLKTAINIKDRSSEINFNDGWDD